MERKRVHKYFDDILGHERVEGILSAPRNVKSEEETEVEWLLNMVRVEAAAAPFERFDVEENAIYFEEEEYLDIDFELDKLNREYTSREMRRCLDTYL